ncbi:tetratricopeptide repeat protein [Photobacterium phosphoreum]|uniref:tetratricopeptide repeat protein n=1 Tax=Photobacterium phosphoreum TaxID=659 RepID=UPI001E296EB6|nr:tetratricopeptide repeat protein [Photobacterium phosphoreum]MCD9473350.1 hypothetical protein [Photobacterium phosphoreum]MCF2174176.1 hypothetical protein [Photobacterium phosphoreum]
MGSIYLAIDTEKKGRTKVGQTSKTGRIRTTQTENPDYKLQTEYILNQDVNIKLIEFESHKEISKKYTRIFHRAKKIPSEWFECEVLQAEKIIELLLKNKNFHYSKKVWYEITPLPPKNRLETIKKHFNNQYISESNIEKNIKEIDKIKLKREMALAKDIFIAAKNNNPRAQGLASHFYNHGRYTKLDPKKALSLAKKSAVNGDGYGQFQLGEMLYHGSGCPVDKEQGLYWLIVSANNGEINAKSKLRMIQSREERNMSFFEITKRKAEGGDINAQHDLSKIYASGRLVKQDIELSNFWQKKYQNNKSKYIK